MEIFLILFLSLFFIGFVCGHFDTSGSMICTTVGFRDLLHTRFLWRAAAAAVRAGRGIGYSSSWILYTIFERIRLAAFGGRTTIITMYVIEQYVTGTKYFLGKFSKMFYWLEQVQSKAIRRPLLTCSSVSHEGKSISSWGEICLSTLSGEIHLVREIQPFWPTEQKPSWSGLSGGGRKRENSKQYLSSTFSFF